MALQFVFGPSGAGKSQYMYNHIIQASMKHTQKNYVVLVPEQFTMETQRELCSLHPNGGIMNIDVLSFGRLAYRIFEETGGNNRFILDDAGKNLMIRKLAETDTARLRFFGKNLKKPGYISEVKSLLSEFTQYGLQLPALRAFMQTLEKESCLYLKLQDICELYAGFMQALADKYIINEELLDVLSAVVPRSVMLKDSVLVIDGFTGFTPVQNKLLGELLKVCGQVFVSVVIDPNSDPFVYGNPDQLFALSKKMTTTLVKIACDNKIVIDEPITLFEEPIRRFVQNKELGFLEKFLFRNKKEIYEEKVSRIQLKVAANPREEVEYITGEIRRLVREGNLRYRDIGVIVADIDVYGPQFIRALATCEIPCFVDYKKSIMLNSFVDYIRSLLEMIDVGFSYDGVFHFLRTGLTMFTQDEIDQLDDYVRATGIHSFKKWCSPWLFQTRDVKEEKLAEVNALRVRFVEWVEPLVLILKQRKKTVQDITECVYDFFVQERIQQKLRDWEMELQELGELALAKEYAQIYRIVIDLLDQFVALLGDEVVSLLEYREILDSGLEEAKVGVIPPTLDQVLIGDMERSRMNQVKALFFVGANDCFIPGNLRSSGLLSEEERLRFDGAGIALAPGGKEQIFIQKLYLYLALSKPQERLGISFSRNSLEGKSLRHAYLVSEIKKIFPYLHTEDVSRMEIKDREWTIQTALAQLGKGLSNRRYGLDDTWKELFTCLQKGAFVQKGRVQKMVEASFFAQRDETLSTAEADVLYGHPDQISVSRLENFAGCPYQHFLRYGLRLREREEYQFESLDLGNIAHAALESFSKKVQESGDAWMDLEEGQRAKWVAESVDAGVADYGNQILHSSSRYTYLIQRIKKLVYRSVWALTAQMAKGDFRPVDFELNFGSGKIDRIDICETEAEILVKVTDYKTGSKSFDITSFYHGLQLQLPVYLNVAVDLQSRENPEKNVVPAGFLYYQMQDPLVEKQEDMHGVEQEILGKLQPDGLILGTAEVLPHFEAGYDGKSKLIPGRSKQISAADFALLLDYTKKKVADLKESIYGGEIRAIPFQMDEQTGCDYCSFRGVCGFDSQIDGYGYGQIEKMSRGVCFAKMKEELE